MKLYTNYRGNSILLGVEHDKTSGMQYSSVLCSSVMCVRVRVLGGMTCLITCNFSRFFLGKDVRMSPKHQITDKWKDGSCNRDNIN